MPEAVLPIFLSKNTCSSNPQRKAGGVSGTARYFVHSRFRVSSGDLEGGLYSPIPISSRLCHTTKLPQLACQYLFFNPPPERNIHPTMPLSQSIDFPVHWLRTIVEVDHLLKKLSTVALPLQGG